MQETGKKPVKSGYDVEKEKMRIKDIEDPHGRVYLRRYTLLEMGRFGRLYLHRILRSDYDRYLHDHPFNFAILILWGGYYEHVFVRYLRDRTRSRVLTKKLRRYPGSLAIRSATHAHRIELKNERTSWSLFWRGPKIREWGFFTPSGWVPWTSYDRAGVDHVRG